jgi:hypothetical protein
MLLLHNKKQIISRYRFRQVPTFGGGVIRLFANNASEMKRLAARDFEDILQVLPFCFTVQVIYVAH